MEAHEILARTEEKFDRIMSSLSGFSERLSKLEAQVSLTDEHRSNTSSTLASALSDIGELRGTVRILEERYFNAKTEVAEIKGTVNALEQARWWIVGAAAGFSTAASIVVLVVDHLLSS